MLVRTWTRASSNLQETGLSGQIYMANMAYSFYPKIA